MNETTVQQPAQKRQLKAATKKQSPLAPEVDGEYPSSMTYS